MDKPKPASRPVHVRVLAKLSVRISTEAPIEQTTNTTTARDSRCECEDPDCSCKGLCTHEATDSIDKALYCLICYKYHGITHTNAEGKFDNE